MFILVMHPGCSRKVKPKPIKPPTVQTSATRPALPALRPEALLKLDELKPSVSKPVNASDIKKLPPHVEELVIKGGGYGLFDGCAAGDTASAIVLKVDVK